MTPYCAADIARDEGCELSAYPDPLTGAGPWTIGYGHTGPEVHPGLTWTQDQASLQLAKDIAAKAFELDQKLGWWRALSDPRQDVLVNMAFNMGVEGLLTFRHTLDAIERGDFAAAASCMLASKWSEQVHDRAKRLAVQMQTGTRA